MDHTPEKSQRRLEYSEGKFVMFTPQGKEKIKDWADKQGLNFSAAIETLALIALEEMGEKTNWQVATLRGHVLHIFRTSFNRFAKLLSSLVYDVRYCKLMLETIVLQIVRQTAEQHPRDFDDVMQVSTDRRKSPDAQIRQTYTEWKEWVQMESKRDVRKAIRQALLELMAEDETDEETTAVGA